MDKYTLRFFNTLKFLTQLRNNKNYTEEGYDAKKTKIKKNKIKKNNEETY